MLSLLDTANVLVERNKKADATMSLAVASVQSNFKRPPLGVALVQVSSLEAATGKRRIHTLLDLCEAIPVKIFARGHWRLSKRRLSVVAKRRISA
jgi:hypothetical protein